MKTLDIKTMRTMQLEYAILVLDYCLGNKAEACRLLNIHFRTLDSILKEAQGMGFDINQIARRPKKVGQVKTCKQPVVRMLADDFYPMPSNEERLAYLDGMLTASGHELNYKKAKPSSTVSD